MKKLLLTLTLIIATSTLFTGCVSTGTAPAQPTAQTIADTAIVLRGVARSAATLAIADNAKNKQYIQLSVAALDTFVVGNVYAPGALVAALAPIIKSVNDPKISLALNALTDVYEIFYGRYVKDKIAANQTAVTFITALRDGAAQALTP